MGFMNPRVESLYVIKEMQIKDFHTEEVEKGMFRDPLSSFIVKLYCEVIVGGGGT